MKLKVPLIEKIRQIPLLLSALTLLLIFFDLGFEKQESVIKIIHWIYALVLVTGILSLGYKYFNPKTRPAYKAWPFDSALLVYLLFLLPLVRNIIAQDMEDSPFLSQNIKLNAGLILIFIREFSDLKLDIKRQFLQPAQLFILSFLILILSGTLLLMLPNASVEGIEFLDALFTATSAVCITGLVVVETGTYFTEFGQIVILVLIQLGGLGIMTFASYFSYFFRGGASYENQLMLRDITNSDKLDEVFGVLKKIILVTFLVEGMGAIFIYTSLLGSPVFQEGGRLFFSIFHAISAFCNAGFSTLPDGMYDEAYRYNYPLHLSLSFLIILGGFGFPILFNLYKYLKHLLVNRILPLSRNQKSIHRPWVINLNTRIISITTGILTITGAILFYILEYDNTLSEHNFQGKIVTAFFDSVTTRSSGFNTVDFSGMRIPSILIVIFFMWIGAAPGSTGGGIKTSTFAIACLNIISIARGKDRVEVYRREIALVSVRRAFAIIALSFLAIGTSVILVSIFESDTNLLPVVFECVSAFTTTGLSLGITSDLQAYSKCVIIVTMFVGRVGMLTILIAIMRRVKHLNYRYPSEEIMIN